MIASCIVENPIIFLQQILDLYQADIHSNQLIKERKLLFCKLLRENRSRLSPLFCLDGASAPLVCMAVRMS